MNTDKKHWRVKFFDCESLRYRTKEFWTEETNFISSREWAEDVSYRLADKGRYELEEIKIT